MATEPHDTVTFLFTDIEGSTKLWDQSQERMSAALKKHDDIVRGVIERNNGKVFKTVGDAFCTAFSNAPDAVAAAIEVQRRLADVSWTKDAAIFVREAIHTGSPETREGDYFGPPLNRVARLLSAAHGTQIVLSMATAELARDSLPEGVSLRDLGEHHLRDLFRSEHVFQVIANGLRNDFPPILSLDAGVKNNLPRTTTSFIGRDSELAAVRDIVDQRGTRLVTLTGPGGTGKTRLALQIAADLIDSFTDGVYFVDLSAETDPDRVGNSIAQALGFEVPGEMVAVDLLKQQLADRKTLILLDNFEHLESAAGDVSALLGGCGDLTFLVTSRSRLNLYGEHEYPVPALRFPDDAESPETLSKYEAVRLFINRAQAVLPSFEITTDNSPAIAEICSRLDGLPLAIELAAAHIRLLPPRALLARLVEGLAILGGGSRDLPARQQTIRGAIEWSYRLLDADESTLFRRLGVFEGSWSIEAAEEVCTGGQAGLSIVRGDTISLIESLLDRSLISRVDITNVPRFTMLTVLREFARERLEETGESDQVAQALLGMFRRRLDIAMGHEAGTEKWKSWIASLEGTEPNFRAAVEYAVCSGQANVVCEFADAVPMVQTWNWTTGRSWVGWLVRALGLVPEANSRLRGKLLAYICGWAAETADVESGLNAGNEALLLLRPFNDSADLAYALRALSLISFIQGNEKRGVEMTNEALNMSRRLKHSWGMGEGCIALGQSHLRSGHFDKGITRIWEGLKWMDSTYLRCLAPSYALLSVTEIMMAYGIERSAPLLQWSIERLRFYGSQEAFNMIILIHAASRLTNEDTQAALLHGFVIEHMRRYLPYIENHPVYGETFRNLAARLRDSLGENKFLSATKCGSETPSEEVFAIAESITEGMSFGASSSDE